MKLQNLKKTKEHIFRFDDICINSDMSWANDIANIIIGKIKDCIILYAVSPLVNNMENLGKKDNQRVFPKIYNAFSDYRVFYNIDKCGIPLGIHKDAIVASHGLIHVDHRLLDRSAQEVSILSSCGLLKSNIFVPPFNKWNNSTEDICTSNGIELVKFEDGWKCCEYNNFNIENKLWYLHHREFDIQEFEKWINSTDSF